MAMPGLGAEDGASMVASFLRIVVQRKWLDALGSGGYLNPFDRGTRATHPV
jgi:hypothetical protein